MDERFTQKWMSKFRKLAWALAISGALNFGLLTAFLVVLWQPKEPIFSFAQKSSCGEDLAPSNVRLIKEMLRCSFRELCACLTNRELVEEGYTKRDLALAVLVHDRCVDVEKALGGSLEQKRCFTLDNGFTLDLYPGLNDAQFQAIVQFVYLEKWPLTPKGLFRLVKQSVLPRDSSLEEAFSLTPEFDSLRLLFQNTKAQQSRALLMQLASEGSWNLLHGFAQEQMQMLDLSVDKRRRLLLSYLALRSPMAAELLLCTDFEFALKRLDDRGIQDILDLVKGDLAESFSLKILNSPRSDRVWEKAVRCLAFHRGETLAVPFDVHEELVRFTGFSVVVQKEAPLELIPSKPQVPEWVSHTVQEGDSLWKIARQYGVKIDELVKLNDLDKDKLYPGMVLRIPQDL